MRFKFTSPGQPIVYRNEFDTDTILRIVYGDNAKTTAKLMAVSTDGKPLTFTYKDVTITVEREE